MVLGLTVVTLAAGVVFLHDQVDALYARIATDFAALLPWKGARVTRIAPWVAGRQARMRRCR
jgi:hypothetical protein